MAVKASDTITIYHVIDVDSTTIYYLLQSSTANPPAKPTTDNPGGNWTITEPTYTEGSTNTLYTVTKTKYSNGDFEYTPVSKSTSYEAAKAAYNKANQANTNALAADKFVISDSQPSSSDQDKLWYDTTTQKIKKWIPANPDDPSSIAKWIIVNDYSGEISAVLDVANGAASAAGQIDQKIAVASSNLTSEITGQYEAYVSSEFTKYDDSIKITINSEIAANNTITNVASNFSFEEDGLYIGKSDSQYKLQAANDRINMLYYDENNNKQIISYWNRDVFNSSKIETNEFSIPPFKWFLRTNGSLSLRKE